jgi:hypothetical protein
LNKTLSGKPGAVQSDREALLEALLLEGPEFTFKPRGSPDPRLKRLVAILARQAARECYEVEVRLARERQTTALRA